MKLQIHTDGFDGWAKRARERAKAMDEGRDFPPSKGITFESAADMVRLLTPARLDLIQHSVEPRHQHRGECKVGIRRRIGRAEFHALRLRACRVHRDAARRRSVAPRA